ncbi:MAG: divergent PAP2 family protein [Bacteroidales bacterium]|nr:divergent PAP2 family protein [Bacteroidales bacterium]
MNSVEYLLSPGAAWIVSQVLKIAIHSIKSRKLALDRAFGDGGMPSTHSAVVCALATTCLLCFGFLSIQFAIAAVLAFLMMHDASGIRMESGKQAKAINDLQEQLNPMLTKPSEGRLEEFLGHTRLQVLMGALTGIIVALIVHQL